MKKNILFLSVFMLVVAAAIVIDICQKHTAGNSILSANVEALSSYEVGYVPCVKAIGFVCFTTVYDANGDMVDMRIEDMIIKQ